MPHVGLGAVADNVALWVVPAVVAVQVKVGFTVRFIAVVHSSLGGGGGNVPRQTSKLAAVPTVGVVV